MNKLSVLNPFYPMLNDSADDIFSRFGLEDYKMNVKDKGDQFEISLAAPDFNENDFNISIENGVVTISAEVKKDEEKNDSDVIRREYITRSFSRSFSLPSQVDSDAAKAYYENGILTIELKKAESAKTKKIEVVKKK